MEVCTREKLYIIVYICPGAWLSPTDIAQKTIGGSVYLFWDMVKSYSLDYMKLYVYVTGHD